MDIHFGGGELTVIAGLLSTVVGGLVAIFRLLMLAKDAQIADLGERLKNSDSVAADAVRMMQIALDRKREVEGMPPVKPMAPVVPEHHSPTTEAQEATARQATLRAAVVAAGLELGVDSRVEAPTAPAAPTAADLISKAEVVAAVLSVPLAEPAKADVAKADVAAAVLKIAPAELAVDADQARVDAGDGTPSTPKNKEPTP